MKTSQKNNTKILLGIISITVRLIRNLIKLKGTAKLTAQGEWVCLKDFKYILFEILENMTLKGRTSSCQPSQPNCKIGFARPAGACTALPCPIFKDFKQNIF